MKDEDVIELIRNKQFKKVSEKLYVYFPVVKKLVLKNNGAKEDAEDIYQEALLVLINKASNPNFILTSSLNTYLYSVSRYLWSDELKRRNKKPVSIEEFKIDALDDEDMLNTIKEEQNSKLAEKAFAMIGEKCKELLQLFYFQKLSMKEIAEKLQFSTEKVAKNQKYRCLEKTKENLKNLKNI
jgi:RNA polymerase sigma factor (sigma-70 family)